MFRLIINSIKKEYISDRDRLHSISQDVISGIGAVISLLGFASAITCFIIIFARFVLSGGYEEVFDNIFSLRGNAGSFYEMPYLAILGGFNITMLLISYILFFKNENWGLRIVGFIPFLVVLGCCVAWAVMLHLYKQGQLESIDERRKLVYSLIIASFIAIVVSIIILLLREKVMSRSCLRMLVFSFGILPLLTLCFENIAFMVVVLVALFILGIFIKGNSSAGNKSSYERTKQYANNSTVKPSGITKEQQQAIYDINRRYKEESAKIVKAHGEVGAFAFSDSTNKELTDLRKRLEEEAESKGVKGKVSIY